MERTPEPELMDEAAQARAYAEADFSEPHDHFVALFAELFPDHPGHGTVLDLGCGPADIVVRFAQAYPGYRIHGVDAAAAMLAQGRKAVQQAGVGERVQLIEGYLPGASLPQPYYDAIISNSLLHHLADPMVLWETIRAYGRPGQPVLIMDLLRPRTAEQARALVQTYAADEPPVLQRDFHQSLHAAYRPEEVAHQILRAGLAGLEVRVTSDRHLVVSGRLP